MLLRERSGFEARLASEGAATLVEYALLVALVALVTIAALQVLGGNLSDQIENIGRCIDDAQASECELP